MARAMSADAGTAVVVAFGRVLGCESVSLLSAPAMLMGTTSLKCSSISVLNPFESRIETLLIGLGTFSTSLAADELQPAN